MVQLKYWNYNNLQYIVGGRPIMKPPTLQAEGGNKFIHLFSKAFFSNTGNSVLFAGHFT